MSVQKETRKKGSEPNINSSKGKAVRIEGKIIMGTDSFNYSDLEVKILDELSSFYEDEEGNTWLDHDPKTLGYEKIEHD